MDLILVLVSPLKAGFAQSKLFNLSPINPQNNLILPPRPVTRPGSDDDSKSWLKVDIQRGHHMFRLDNRPLVRPPRAGRTSRGCGQRPGGGMPVSRGVDAENT